MKKLLLLLFAIIITISCESKKPIEKLQDAVEKKIVSNLNDPSSYEFVSFKEDTFEREVLKQRIIDIKNQLKKLEKSNDKEQILNYNDQLIAAENMKLPENQLEFKIEYRAKNKFNALILGSSKVISDKNYNLISVTENL